MLTLIVIGHRFTKACQNVSCRCVLNERQKSVDDKICDTLITLTTNNLKQYLLLLRHYF